MNIVYEECNVFILGGYRFGAKLWFSWMGYGVLGVELGVWERLLGLWVLNTRGGWTVFLKVVANFSQTVTAPVRTACSWLSSKQQITAE